MAHHERAQDERLAGHLLAARTALRECLAVTCPSLVSRDCVHWLAEVQQQIPSVIFAASKDGEDVVALRVSEGERLLAQSTTGTPVELDPGPHHFVAEVAGFPPQRATYVLQAGDQARVVRFEFVSEPTSQVRRSPAPIAFPAPTSATPSPWRPTPAVTYVFAGAAVLGGVTGSVLGTLALSKRKEVERRCAPLCDEREVGSVRNLALGADLAVAVALLSAGAAAYTYATRPSVPTRDGAPLRISWSGLGITARGRF